MAQHILEKLVISHNGEDVEYLNSCNGTTLVWNCDEGLEIDSEEGKIIRQIYIANLYPGSFISVEYKGHVLVFLKDGNDFQLISNTYSNSAQLRKLFYGYYYGDNNKFQNNNQIILNYYDDGSNNKIYISILCPFKEEFSNSPEIYVRPSNSGGFHNVRAYDLKSYPSKHVLISSGTTTPGVNSPFNLFIQTAATAST